MPEFAKNKKGCFNIENTDNKCFLWSILTYLHPSDDRHVDRLSKYKPYENEFEFKWIANFPIDIQEICKFKNKYNVEIQLFEIREYKVIRADIPKISYN